MSINEHIVRCEIQDEGPGFSESDKQKLLLFVCKKKISGNDEWGGVV